jgi:ATP-dependent exoDNAse (exonuclease V) beta subunit
MNTSKKLSRTVLASAGTGKTYQLSVRIARLIMKGAPPERIMALTFTRAAAGEFFLRVIQRLKEAAEDDKKRQLICYDPESDGLGDSASDNPLRLDPKDPKYSKAAFEAKLREVLMKSDRLALSTLDSYFVRLVGAFPMELGVSSPKVETIADEDMDDVRQSTVNTLIEEHAEDLDELLSIAKDYTSDEAVASPAAQIVNLVKKGRTLRTSAPDAKTWGNLSHVFEGGIDPRITKLSPAEALKHCKVIAEWAQKNNTTPHVGLVETFCETPGNPGRLLALVSSARPHLDDEKLYTTLLDSSKFGGFANLDTGETSTVSFKNKPLTDKITPDLRSAFQKIQRHLLAVTLQSACTKTQAFRKLLDKHEETYQRTLTSRGRFAFEDYTNLLGNRLLTKSQSDADAEAMLEWIYFRMDCKVTHWLLDEFQDTSTNQYDVLSRNLKEVMTDAENERSVFAVGDVKQSLYEWREGNRALLPILEAEIMAAKGTSKPIDRTRRCCRQVLEMVNAVLMEPKTRGLGKFTSEIACSEWEKHFRRQEADPAAPKHGLSAWVRITSRHEKDGKKDNVIQNLPAQAAWIAEDLRRTGVLVDTEGRMSLVKGITCAVIVTSNEDARNLSDRLRDADIESNHETKVGFIEDNPATNAVFSILKSVAHPDDGTAKGMAKMYPFTAKFIESHADGELSEEIARRFLEKGAEATVHWICEKIDVSKDEDAFLRRRLSQLRSVAAEYDRGEERDLLGFLAFAEKNQSRDITDKQAIQVLTFHRAKGLEYDVVYMPMLNRSKPMAQPPAGSLYLTPAMEVVAQGTEISSYEEGLFRPKWVLHGVDKLAAKSLQPLKAATEALTADNAYGALCRLYVGMTRAKHKLVLISNDLGEDGMEMVPDKVRERKTPGAMRENNDYFEKTNLGGFHNFADFVESTLGKPRRVHATEKLGEVSYQFAWQSPENSTEADWIAECLSVAKKPEKGTKDKKADKAKKVEPMTPIPRPRRTLPSKAESLANEDSDEKAPKNRGPEYGSYVHALLQDLGDKSDTFLESLKKGASGPYGTMASDEIRQILENQDIRKILLPGDVQKEDILVELPILVKKTDDEYLTGTFDRIHLYPGQKAVIMDYKTNFCSQAHLVKLYSKQMEEYRFATTKLFGLKAEQVTSYLIHIHPTHPGVVEVR